MGLIDSANPASGKYVGPNDEVNRVEVMRVSDVIDVNATSGGAVAAVHIPLGSLVTKVGFLATAALASADLDIGDGDDTDYYMDGITTLATNVMLVAPFPYSTSSASNVDFTAHTESAARYYAAADTIDVLVNATATSGSGRVVVWFLIDPDNLGT